ncbi:MAG: hypothetical protein PQJ59_16630 [Spirochaetales bacterium]|nr:hypothetical protein [Spirochaetales bacterium]
MIYKILNLIFGWDYVYYDYTNNEYPRSRKHGIGRVFVTYDGQVSLWLDKQEHDLLKIPSPEAVNWLTCDSEKYFLKGENQ